MRRLLFRCVVLPILGLVSLPAPEARGATNEGYWKLVRVERKKIVDRPVEAVFPGRSTVYTVTKNVPGLCMGSSAVHDDASHGGRVFGKETFTIRWSPPPDVLKPGQEWNPDPKTQGTGNYGGASFTTYSRMVDDPGLDLTPHYEGLRGGSGGVRLDAPPRGENKHLIILVGVGARSGLTGNYRLGELHGDVVAYAYRYRWMGPHKLTGQLKIRATPEAGGSARGLTFRIRNLASGARTEVTTDRDGRAEQAFEAEALADEFDIEIEEARWGQGTSLVLAGSPAVSSARMQDPPLRLSIGKRLTLADRKVTTFEYRVPTFKLVLLAYRWDEAKQEWLGTPATVRLEQERRTRFEISRNVFRPDGGKYVAEVVLPTAELLKTSRLLAAGFEPKDKLTGSQAFSVPSARQSAAPVVAILNLSDNWTKLRRFRFRVREFFGDPVFQGVVDPQTARAVSELRFAIDPEATAPVSTREGTTTYNSETFLELTEGENNDTLFHEWTHHLVRQVADDPDVEDRVGGAHAGGFFQVDANPETAWDEGRAHFCSALFNLAFDNPNNSDQLAPESASRWMQENGTVTTPGNRNEGIVGTALIDYYRKAGFRNTREVMAEFLKIHRFAKEQKDVGHPPRTAEEFFAVLKRYNAQHHASQATARNRMVDEMLTKYRIQ